MHNSYQPLKPASNKLLKKRWDGAAQEMHRKKVSGAKSVVDTGSPATYTHLQYKMKKMQVCLSFITLELVSPYSYYKQTL